jgi:hypothetical protein
MKTALVVSILVLALMTGCARFRDLGPPQFPGRGEFRSFVKCADGGRGRYPVEFCAE